MTTDRELTKTELGYLGWEFKEPMVGLFGDYVAYLNGVEIQWGYIGNLISIARNIARAQGITPPVFAVGERVRHRLLHGGKGEIVSMTWGCACIAPGRTKDCWLCHISLGEQIVATEPEHLLERLEP